MIDFSQNYFALFGLPQRYRFDPEKLDTAYRALQRVVHPDRYAAAGDAERRVALQSSARVNEASRALKAMMLVLQAGGFGVVALDLADVRTPALRAFPFTTWLRVARAIEGSETVALLVASERVARSPGGITLALEPPAGLSRARWTGASHRARVLHGVALRPRAMGGR